MTALSDYLNTRKIVRVCCIDDENALPALLTHDNVIDAITNLSPRKIKNVAKLDPRFDTISELREAHKDIEDISERRSILAPVIDALIDKHQLGSDDFKKIGEILHQGHKGDVGNRLRVPFPGGLLETFSFGEWQSRGAAIIAAATADARVLLLVDEVNDQEPDVHLNGVKLLAGLWKDHYPSLAFIDAIVVTSRCQPDGEFNEAITLLKEVRDEIANPEIERAVRRTFVLAKTRLDHPPLEKHFITHLDRMRATDLRSELIEIARDVLVNAVNESVTWLEQIPLSEFQGAIFASSENEGAAEIDTLLRLVNLRQRLNLEDKLKFDAGLKNKIAELRKFSLKDMDAEYVKSAQTELRTLRQLEFERPGLQINSLMAPISSGDVFKLNLPSDDGVEEVEVVLLGNPCDLVLRSDGTRKLHRGWLVRVTKDTRANIDAEVNCNGARAPLAYVLPTGHRDEDPAYLFHNSDVESVDLHILDLCWSNEAGKVGLDLVAAIRAYDFVLSPQRQRLEHLARRIAEGKIGNTELWGKQVLMACETVPNVSIGAVQVGAHVSFPISRVWRLAPEFASAVLLSLSQSIARPVFGHDYSRME